MNNRAEARESQECASKHPAGTIRSTTTTKSSEGEACLALFIGVLTGGSVINIVYEVIFATGSPAYTIHSIITDMWKPRRRVLRHDDRGRDIQIGQVHVAPAPPTPLQV